MRLAVISDVHGNALALEAVLRDIEGRGADRIVSLGDHVSGPLEPGRAIDLQREAGCIAIRGNHDRVVCGDGALGALDALARQKLSSEQMRWLAALPATVDLDGEVLLCHGTPASDIENWLDAPWTDRTTRLPDEAFVTAKAEGYEHGLMLCGHSHVARAVRLRDGRHVVNPGAVGLQIVHGSPDARYAMIERFEGDWRMALLSVSYDAEAAAAQAVANGFPAWEEALLTGWAGPEGLF